MDEIKNSEFIDVAAPILDDVAPEQLIKVYPYQLINAEKGAAFVKNNATSIVSVSQSPYYNDEVFHNLSEDKDGNLYFDLLASVDVSGKLDLSSHTSTYGKELKYEHNFVGITDQYYDHKDEMPVMFTIGEPYDEKKYETDEIQAFIADSIIPAQEFTVGSMMEVMSEDINQETLTEISFINIKAVEAQFTNARVLFYEDLNYSDLKTSDSKGNIVPGVEIEMDSHSLINSIKGKGLDLDEFSDVDFKVENNLLPFKFTILDTQENVTGFADWFDYDMVMPLFIADKFIAADGASLEVLKTIQLGGQPFIGDDELNLIRDVIAYSYAFATKFNDFPKYTADEAKAQGASVKPGDLKGEYTIGHTVKHTVLSLAGQDPVKSIDELFKTYELKFPRKEESNEYRAVKQLTAGLSKFIYSTYAIGKGYNSFNQIYLPWYLIPFQGISLTKTQTNFELPTDLKFKLYSEWFDVTTSNVKAKEDINISELRMIQTDRKLSLPNVPEIIQAQNKLPLAGDIDTKTDRDLSYVWYLPISSEAEIQKIFLNNPNITVDNNNVDKTIETEWTPYGIKIVSQQEKEKLIEDTMKVLYPNVTYTVKNFGVETSELNPSESYPPYPSGRGTNIANEVVTDLMLSRAGITRDELKQWHTANNINGRGIVNGSAPAGIQTLVENEIAKASGLSVDSFVVSNWGSGIDINLQSNGSYTIFITGTKGTGGSTTMTSSKFRIKLKREKLSGVIVNVLGKSVSVDTDRDTLFDKAKFKDFIYNYLNVGSRFASYKLITKYGQTLEELDELSIASLFADVIKIHIGSKTLVIDTINQDDETVAIQRILFT